MITKRGRELLLGMAIGDGYVRKTESTLQIAHGIKQKAYCEAKAALLNAELGRNIQVKHSVYDNFDTIRFRVSHPYLKLVRGWLYKETGKVLTLSVLRSLSDEAVAIWYMDDGSFYQKKRNGKVHAAELVISTCCSKEEAELVIQFFQERYQISMQLKPMKGRYSVRCGTKNARILVSVLKQYCLPSMEYKFSDF